MDVHLRFVRISVDGDTFLLETEGGSLKVVAYPDGGALVGDWQCDGSDEWAALRLYRAAEKLCDREGLKPFLTSHIEDKRLHEFYSEMGLVPTDVVFRRKKDLEDGQDPTVQNDR